MANSSNAVISSLVLWDEGVAAFEENDLNSALQKFWAIPNPSAKVWFNIGLVHQAVGNLDAAEKAFISCLSTDIHLAIGNHQLGIVRYNRGEFKEAEASFRECHESLRGRGYIDYKQLGLRFVLYECEVLYNLSLTCLALNERHKAFEIIDRAIAAAEQSYKNRSQLVESKRLFQTGQRASLLPLPSDVIFRPPKSKTANIESQNYLGKAKVVASMVDHDVATGFSPIVKNMHASTSRPISPHKQANHPNTVPSLHQNLAVPPDRTPPQAPGKPSLVSQMAVSQVQPPDSHVIVKVHFNYTTAFKVKNGTSLKVLQEIVCKKFDQYAGELQLWCIKDKQLGLQNLCEESQITELWKLTTNGRMTLWCYTKESQGRADRATKQVVAVYDFEAQQDCDLSFKTGDIISDVRELDDNWYEGQLYGKTGLIPKSYVQDCVMLPPPPRENTPGRDSAGRREENTTSFGALMKELKSATHRRSAYLEDKPAS